MNNKYFTLDEANATIPYVSLIVNDIVRKRKEMVKLKNDIKQVELEEMPQSYYYQSLKIDLRAISIEIQGHLEELEQVGCYLKDFELGIVDFPSVINNKVVFLSYVYGNGEINYWHELTEGVEQRKLINIMKNLNKLTIFK